MSLQWGRVCELVVGAAGSGLLVRTNAGEPGLRITFEITKTLRSKLNTAEIRVYNLNRDDEAKIKGEFDDVLLNVGYQGQALLAFRGQIRAVATPSDGTDRITTINAADGDHDARKAIVNTTLVAGTTNSQLLDHVVGQLASTKKGHVVIKDKARLRGKVLCGRATDILDDLARDSDAHWSFQDGHLDIVAVDSTLPTEAIVVSYQTGLLDAPEVDDKGVKVRCLLDPRIRCNGKIKLDNNAFKLKVAKERESKPGAKKPKKAPKRKDLARLDPDGIYKVYKIVLKGDTHGNDWFSTVYAVALEKSIPAGRVAA